MASDHKLETVLSHVAGFHLDSNSPPDAAATKTSASIPDAIAVTVTELPSPPASPSGPGEAMAALQEIPGPKPTSPTRPAPGTFPYFPLLPAELRLKIWHMSFLPRAVELHTRRAHYANDDERGGTPKVQSQSRNPAALSVNAEARAAALECYTVKLPLSAPPSGNAPPERPGDLLRDSDRVLYLNLEQDTVVLLGDLHFTRLTKLLDWFRKMDRPTRRCDAAAKGRGLRKLAMSVALFTHEVGAATLKAFARTVFADIDEFILFMYPDRLPPPDWTGGSCVLEEAAADADYYRRFLVGRGRQFRVGDSWMVVGKQPMKVADISFESGW